MTSTKTTVTVTGDGPFADAIRGRADELAAGIDGDALALAGPETMRGAFGEDLRLFDGWQVKGVALKLAGTVKLYLADDVHRDLIAGAKLFDTVRITATIGGHDVELLGHVAAHAFGIGDGDNLTETVSVKMTGALGASGKPVVDDDGKDA